MNLLSVRTVHQPESFFGGIHLKINHIPSIFFSGPRLALSSWLPAIAPSVPQALVPIQYTRRVPTEVPTLEEAVRDALPGTIVLLARGTHTLASPLIINKQVRIKGGSEPQPQP